MSKKLYALISGILGGVAAIAEAVVVYAQPTYAVQIAIAIPIAVKAADEIMLLFVPVEQKK